jgi:hypothetical protein
MRIVVLLVVVYVAVPSIAQTPFESECIIDLLIPPYPELARSASITGTVEVHVVLTANETPLVETEMRTELPEGQQRLLRLAVEEAAERSAFAPVCSGRELTWAVVFELEGGPSVRGATKMRFRPPNTFVVISRPGSTPTR